jgi:ABC-type antimicrobial peptide transport system ATPase subunit
MTKHCHVNLHEHLYNKDIIGYIYVLERMYMERHIMWKVRVEMKKVEIHQKKKKRRERRQKQTL